MPRRAPAALIRAIRSGAIRVMDGALVVQTMHWPDEIRAASFKKPSGRVTLREQEEKMARQLVQQ
jgi:DNA end-binding protein Ku